MPDVVTVVRRVRQLLADLNGCDLTPRPEIDAIFEELVDVSLRHRGRTARAILDELGADVSRVRLLCADGETALERHWSERIASASYPWDELRRFPYAANYDDLVALELAVAHGCGAKPSRVACIGSGPLPLTGITLAATHGHDVLLIDRDPSSLAAGDRLVTALGLSDRVSSVLVDVGADRPDLQGVDLVVYGALVGGDPIEKRAMLTSLGECLDVGSWLVVRTATGLRELLYPPADLAGVQGLTTMLELHPHNATINSILLARRNQLAPMVGDAERRSQRRDLGISPPSFE